MVTVSLCMIVENDEENLSRCLDSVKDLVDEIILVDTGSTDRTKETALKYAKKAYSFPWRDDFSQARNFAFSKAAMQYCLWLDADDLLEPEDRERFRLLKLALPPQTDVVMMPYHTPFDGQGSPMAAYYRARLVRRSAGLSWRGAVHETVVPVGNVVYCEAAVTCRGRAPGSSGRKLRVFEKLLYEKKALSPREQFFYAQELASHGRDEEAADIFEEFLASGTGWVEQEIEAGLRLAQCCQRLGRPEQALSSLLGSLRLGPPRAETCCGLGRLFFEREQYPAAVFWYETALSRPRGDAFQGFVIPDCYGYLPCRQLSVCLFRLGRPDLAGEYRERADKWQPYGAARPQRPGLLSFPPPE